MLNSDILKKTSKRKFLKIVGASLLGSLAYGIYSLTRKEINKSYWTGNVLGVPSKVELHSKDRRLNNHLIAEIDKLVFKYENIFNIQNRESEINILNTNKVIPNASQELINVIKKSMYVSDQTNGLFDITVQPLWELYFKHFIIDNNKSAPDPEAIKSVLKSVGWKYVEVDGNKLSLHNNSSITLNGIAQGWITDQIKVLLSQHGFENTLVDFGENYASGLFEKARPWNILVEGRNTEKLISLSNMAIATSAGYGTSFEPSIQHHHIFNSKNGKSANNFKAVSVISKKAWLSDAVSTASLSMSKTNLKAVCKKLKLKALIQEKNNFIQIT